MKSALKHLFKKHIFSKLPPHVQSHIEKVKPMLTNTNFVLLLAVLGSAYHVVDLNNSIKHETHLYGKAQEQEIRLNQDYAELQYELSQAVDTKIINNAAMKMKMHEPSVQETVILELR